MAKIKDLEEQGKVLPRNASKVSMPKVKECRVEILEDDGAIPALDLAPYIDPKTKALEIRGNYDAVKNELQSRLDVMAKMKFSARDLETVVKYNKEAKGYRILLATAEKSTKSTYFNGPKDVFVGKMATLTALAEKMEALTLKILDAEEAKRTSALTEVLEIYKADFQQKYGLTAENLARIEFKAAYYNKTAKEAATKLDIEAQFIDLASKQKARASGIRMIQGSCGENKLLDVARYTAQLDNGEELANVLDAIEAEKKRLTEVTAEAEPDALEEVEMPSCEARDGSSSAFTPEKVVLGVRAAAGSLLTDGSDFPDKTKTMVLDIMYPVDMADALTAVFRELLKYGIKSKVHKESVF